MATHGREGQQRATRSDVIAENIERLRLIDQYLNFMKSPGAYHLIGERMERFIEAVNILRSAKNQQRPAEWVNRLRIALFAHIRDMTMNNWDLRQVLTALGGKKHTAVSEVALDEFMLDGDIKDIQEKLASSGPKSSLASKLAEKAQDFLEAVEAGKAAGQPARLASRAQKNLAALDQALASAELTKHQGWQERIKPVPQLIGASIELGKQCLKTVEKLQASAAKPERHSKKK